MQRQCFHFADLTGNIFIAAGLACLAFKLAQLGFQIGDGLFQFFQIALGAIETQFGLVTTRMQARYAGRLFQYTAACLRLGIDNLTDLPLLDQ